MDKERLLQNTRLLARALGVTPRELVERGIIAREDYEAIASYDEEKIALLAKMIGVKPRPQK